MPLIVSRTVSKELREPPEGASKYYVAVGMDYLSEPYHLDDGSKVVGEILKCTRGTEEFPQLVGVRIKLILKKREIIDHLFISREDWDNHFREWGLVQSGYELVLRLISIVNERGSITQRLYQKRDVSV